MKGLIIKALEYAADNGIICNVRSTNGMFNTYHDANGQRQCKIEYNGYGTAEQRKENYKGIFSIVRHLSFTNNDDEGKNGAILMDIFPNKLTDSDKVKISNSAIEFGGFEFIFYTDLKLDI